MRTLLLCREGAPLFTEITSGPIRAYLAGIEGLDNADLYQVWEVHPLDARLKSEDITARFAEEWSREIAFGDGIEPQDYLSPFPAFVLSHARAVLIARWQCDVARMDGDFVPNPIRRVA